MSMYRVRPNKTNRVWPPVKDTQESKDLDDQQESHLRKSLSRDRTFETNESPAATETKPEPTRKLSWRNRDLNLSSKEPCAEVPSKSLLRPIKSREKPNGTAEPSSSTASEVPLKAALRPLKPKETPIPKKESFTKPVLRPVKTRENTVVEKEPESPSKVDPDCEWKREAFRRQNRWSKKSTDAPNGEVEPSVKTLDKPALKKSVPISKNSPKNMEDSPSQSDGKTNGPPGPPPPPPPPPPPGGSVPNAPPCPPGFKKKVAPKKGSKKLVDNIKKAARTRPDWKTLMKDLEGGIKLKHVKSEDKLDRSSPLLESNRGKEGKFLYESEENPDAKQSKLLNEIQRGIKLRKTRTNDRSRPDFQRLGIKKLKRQMTKDEKKAIPADAPEALPSSSDEDEDIDTMRDDLKATKLQLAEEIKKTKQMEREAKIQNIDNESYKAEVKKLKRQLKEAGVQDVKPIRNCEAADMVPKLSKSMSKLRLREEDMDFSDLDVIDEEIKTLEDQIDAQRKRAEKVEQKNDELNMKLKLVNNTSDEWELRSVYFEKKYKAMQKEQGIELPDISCIGTQTDPVEFATQTEGPTLANLSRKSASRKSFGGVTHMKSFQEEEEEEDSEEEEEESSESSSSESEEESDESGSEAEVGPIKRGEHNESKRKDRDLGVWESKVSQSKEKIRIARKERNALRDKIRKHYENMRCERKEYLRVKEELNELVGPTEEEEQSESESSEDSDSDESTDRKKKPRKISKRGPAKNSSNGETDSPEEDLEDMTTLQDPAWGETDSEEQESESEQEEDQNTIIRKLQDKHQNWENKYSSLKKESYTLRTQVTRCNEMYNEEKRRHQRLDNELQMLLTCLE